MTIKLSIQEGKGFKKFIGGKNFYLGHDKTKAEQLALYLCQQWEQVSSYADEWPDDALAAFKVVKARMLAGELPTTPVVPAYFKAPADVATAAVAPVASVKAVSAISVADAVAKFKAVVAASGKRSDGWKAVLVYRLDSLALSGSLAGFGHDAISSKVDALIGKAKAGRYSAATAIGTIRVLRQFVDWLDSTDSVQWEAPRRWEKLFKVSEKQLTSGKAKNAKLASSNGDLAILNVADLGKLYQAADNRARLFLLLGLQCGFTQADLATLTPEMVKLDKGYLERFRSKTGVYCRWSLWAETSKLLKAELEASSGKSNDPLFSTRNGKPLVWLSEDGIRNDAVYQIWYKLQDKAGVKASFKMLRKTGSQFIRDIAGKDVAEVWLAHTEKGVVTNGSGQNAYNRFGDWEAMEKTIMAMRAKVADMFKEAKA